MFRTRNRRSKLIETLERRLLLAGQLDTTFNGTGKVTIEPGGGVTFTSTDVAVQQADSKVIVVGYDNNGAFVVARFNENGTPDTTFGTGNNGVVTTTTLDGYKANKAYGVAIQNDGDIVVVGAVTATTGPAHTRFGIARFLSTGLPDPGFGGGDGTAVTGFGQPLDAAVPADVGIQGDGKILVGGTASIGGDDDFALVRYDVNGTPDTSFDGDGISLIDFGGNDRARGILCDYINISSNYATLLVGETQSAGTTQFAIARIDNAGFHDSNFSGDGKLVTPLKGGYAYSSAADIAVNDVQTNHAYVFVGRAGPTAGNTNFCAMRLTAGGGVDSSYGGIGYWELDLGPDDSAEEVITNQMNMVMVAGSSGGQMVATCLTNVLGVVDSLFGVQTRTFDGLSVSAIEMVRAPGGKVVATAGGAFTTARFFDRAPAVSLERDGNSATEGGGDSAEFYFEPRQGEQPPSHVYYTVSGTAKRPGTMPVASVDYSGISADPDDWFINWNFTFSESEVVTLTAHEDGFAEFDETVIITLVERPGVYDIVPFSKSITIKIIDNDRQIYGTVYNDANSNGIYLLDVETPLSGWTVYNDSNNNNALDAAETSTVSNAQGEFLFANLGTGTFYVRQVTKSGYRRTQPVPPVNRYELSISTGQTHNNINFGNTTNVLLSGTVYNDVNHNGTQDAGELGLSGIVVNVRSNITTVATRTTDANGFWRVQGLSAGTGSVECAVPLDYSPTNPVSGKYSGSSTSGQIFNYLHFGLFADVIEPTPLAAAARIEKELIDPVISLLAR